MTTDTAYALATSNIAEFLTSAYGTRWYACRDTEGGEWHVECCDSSSHLEANDDRDAVCVEFGRSPGVGNMDSSEWTAGLFTDEDGGYWRDEKGRAHEHSELLGSFDEIAADGYEFIGSVEDVIRECCAEGDVAHHIADLERKMVEATRRLQIARDAQMSS